MAPGVIFSRNRCLAASAMYVESSLKYKNHLRSQNPLDTQDPFSYTPAVKKQCLINNMTGLIERIPFCRLAEPKEIATAHLFFAGDDAGYVTGQVLFVDGGISVGV
ncbi:MAG: SDR family oxidoreductase [Syntrophales bacterium]|nr:SDR family oxidoreductase [Syntrophales bacterium]